MISWVGIQVFSISVNNSWPETKLGTSGFNKNGALGFWPSCVCHIEAGHKADPGGYQLWNKTRKTRPKCPWNNNRPHNSCLIESLTPIIKHKNLRETSACGEREEREARKIQIFNERTRLKLQVVKNHKDISNWNICCCLFFIIQHWRIHMKN